MAFIIFMLFFLVNLVLQLISMSRIVSFITKKTCMKLSMYVLMVLLAFFYVNDILKMMMHSWGAPANNMTMLTQTNRSNRYCLFDNTDETSEANFQVLIRFINYQSTISRFSSLVWTLVLFSSMIYLQCREKNKID